MQKLNFKSKSGEKKKSKRLFIKQLFVIFIFSNFLNLNVIKKAKHSKKFWILGKND